MQAILLMAGGAIGTYLRFTIAGRVQSASDGVFPFGTLTVNVIGAFLAGIIATVVLERTNIPVELRTALLVGLLGGFTTFSAFSVETLSLTNQGAWGFAALNVLASVSAALVAVWAGQSVARLWT